MIIHSYFVAYNEEILLPWILDYHSKFFDQIFVYDNFSTDNSNEIYKRYPKVVVTKYDSKNTLDNFKITQIKNVVYKQSRGIADWVVVSDCDELLYHPNLLEKLQEYKDIGVTMPDTDARSMVAHAFPTYDGTKLITDVIKVGSPERIPSFSKNIVFNPQLDIIYGTGAHTCTCRKAVHSQTREFNLLHYNMISKAFMIERYNRCAKRLSEESRRRGYGTHVDNTIIPAATISHWLDVNYKVIP